MKSAHEVLESTFGFSEFRPYQEDIISTVVEGRDVFLLMPTGGGKSLCYQLPALLRSGTAIVVSPLIALMKDQVDQLVAQDVQAAFYNSSLEEDEARQVLARLHAGELDLLYVAPERLIGGSFIERLRTIDIALIAIDEAHCVSQWGHDFRPEYARLREVRASLASSGMGDIPIIALTATADAQTQADIVEQLALRDPEICITGFDRPNISYRVIDKRKPKDQLRHFLEGYRGESGIVYALSRKRVEKVAAELVGAGVKAAPYHAGLPAERRREVHEAFIRDEIEVVVATVAFGMGIDKPDIRFVVHYDIPKNIEGYYQETGRAGRDGLPAEALLLLGYQDVMTARALVEGGSDPGQQRVDLQKLNHMVAFAEALTCRRQVLLGYFGEVSGDNCASCDICLDPPERFDATIEAQKALSCVYRVGQRFGVRHVVNVLRGMNTEQIRRCGHESLTTYGIGAGLSDVEWMSLLRQLIHRGYLKQDINDYNVLKLTPASRELLTHGGTVELARPRLIKRPPKGVKRKKKRAAAQELSDEGVALFEELRALRTQIARTQGIAPYMVFGDKSLSHMAEAMPTTDDEFLAIHGVGQAKLIRYGESFMVAIGGFAAGSEPG